jgi:hypothetical protein
MIVATGVGMPTPELAETHVARRRFRRRVEGKLKPPSQPIFSISEWVPTALSLGGAAVDVVAAVALITILGWLFLTNGYSLVRVCIFAVVALSVRLGLLASTFPMSDLAAATRGNLPPSTDSSRDKVAVDSLDAAVVISLGRAKG